MMNKLGKLLFYPETWCSFVIRFVLLVVMSLMLVFVLISPLAVYIIKGATADFYFVSVLVGIVYYGCHLVAKDVFYQYVEFLDRLPKCPKINWKKEI